jgi:hypothetical protein
MSRGELGARQMLDFQLIGRTMARQTIAR